MIYYFYGVYKGDRVRVEVANLNEFIQTSQFVHIQHRDCFSKPVWISRGQKVDRKEIVFDSCTGVRDA